MVRWKNAPLSDDAAAAVQTVDTQNWYVYNGAGSWAQDDFNKNKRVFGAKNVGLLYIHLNRTTGYSVEYDLDVTSKIPANQLHLFEAASAFLSAKSEAAARIATAQNVFGITDANISYVPSDLSVTGNFSMAPGELTPIGDSVVFDNEGKYWWDVSVAVPITKMSQLQFNNTDNTVTAAKVDKRTVFAVLDLYPFLKDVKNPGFDKHPYGLVGVGVASQPLHRILVALGWGPQYAQFYVGATFIKQQSLNSLQPGSAATPSQTAADVRMKYSPAFAFGINLTVRDVFQSATTSKKAGQ